MSILRFVPCICFAPLLVANSFLQHHWNSQSRLFIAVQKGSRGPGYMGSINVDGACSVPPAPKTLLYSQQAAAERPWKASSVGIV